MKYLDTTEVLELDNMIYMDTTEVYQEDEKVWKTLSGKLPRAIIGTGGTSINDRILLFGIIFFS